MGFSQLSVALLALAGSSVGADLPSIVMKGSKLFYPNGTQFFMKGVAYQQGVGAAGMTAGDTSFTDPLASASNCERDVPLLAELGTNIIRTYAINPDSDHSKCMQLLNDAGIYVISDLGQPTDSINRDNPTWDVDLFSRYKSVVDELGQYSNVIGFFAGNEVSNNNTNTGASAWVKAAVRDTKAYIKDNKSRWMGVGYAANDDSDIRDNIAHYFNCGDDTDRIDFWGYNIYEWCGQSTIQSSGYQTEIDFFKNYSVPVFFAEYGCNKPNGAAGRLFEETAALYSDAMTPVFTGGIVYMYFEETNDYGLVNVVDNKVTKLKDFSTLQAQVAKADPKGIDSSDYKPTEPASDCPPIGEDWAASSNLPPTPDSDLCDCMVASRSCVPSKDLSSKNYGDLFGFVCGKYPDVCTAINGNASSGVYGSYSMCSNEAKLAYVLDGYYTALKSASSACDFKGQATTQTPKDESSCSKSLAAASAHNSAVVTATAASDVPSSTSTSSSSSSTDDGSLAGPGARVARVFSIGEFTLGLYVLVAAGAGAGMMLL